MELKEITVPEARTQSDIVADLLLKKDIGQEVTDEIETPGSSRIHTLTDDEIITFLEMVLKLRKHILKFEWFLCEEFDGESKVRYPGIDQLYNKPRKEIAETLLNAFQAGKDVVGVTWEPRKPYIIVARREDVGMGVIDKKELNSTIELTYIASQFH